MKSAVLSLMIFAVVLLGQKAAHACSCGDPDLSQSIKNAGAIFSAKAVGVSQGFVVLEVAQVWKGKVPERLKVHGSGSSCDGDFEVGGAYLVYALRRKQFLSGEEQWYTNECARTRKLSEATRDLARLGGFNLSIVKR